MSRKNLMQPKASVAGRSYVFNILFVTLNLLAIIAIAMGFHPNFSSTKWLWLVAGFGFFIFSLAGIILFKGRIMMNNASRVLVGSVFVFSGLIKINDPIGFSYKLQEYFEDGALAYRIKVLFNSPSFSLAYLANYAIYLSVAICLLEILLGVFVLFRQRMKVVGSFVVGLMLFFTFLTWHTATCNPSAKYVDRDQYAAKSADGLRKLELAQKDPTIQIVSSGSKIIVDETKSPQCVTDCGCFGDALKGSLGRSLTPNESLWKDVILLYFTIWLLLAAFKRNAVNDESRSPYWVSALIIIASLSWLFKWIFPIFFGFIAFFVTVWLLRKEENSRWSFWRVGLFVTFLSGLVITYVLMYQPIKDYQPYAVGSNLKWKLHKRIISDQFNPFLLTATTDINLPTLTMFETQLTADEIPGYVLYDRLKDTTFTVYCSNFSLAKYPKNLFGIADSTTLLAPIPSELYGRAEMLKAEKLILVVSSKIKDGDWSTMKKIKELNEEARNDKVPFMMLVSASPEEISYFVKKHQLKFPVFMNDEIELKTMGRSNPTLLVLQKGVVKGKYPKRALPDYKWLKLNILK